MRESWKWFWGGFALAFGIGLARDPVNVLLGCGCLGCGGLLLLGLLVFLISSWLGGMSTFLVLAAAIAVTVLLVRRRG